MVIIRLVMELQLTQILNQMMEVVTHEDQMIQTGLIIKKLPAISRA